MKPDEIMLDLETMSLSKNAAIASIGAVKMNMENLELGEEFHIRIDLPSCQRAGFDIDASTFLWWLGQDEAARASLVTGPRVLLSEALTQFGFFCHEQPVWGNGSPFDNVILANAYKKMGIPAPWSYKQDRCYRTMAAMFPSVTCPPNPIKHDALSDAKCQALHLFDILRHIRGQA